MSLLITALALLRRARLPGLLHLVCAALLASGLLAWPGEGRAATVSNTATVSYTGPAGATTRNSNTVTVTVLPGPTPAQVTFYQYAPGNGTASIAFDGGSYDSTGAGSYSPLAGPLALNGGAISLAAPVEVRPTRVFHLNEPIFITLADANRNADPLVREFIEVVVTTSTGDIERLRLQETGPDTGVFAGVIQSSTAAALAHNGVLTVGVNTRLTVSYQDPDYLDDTSTDGALVDPFGFVFDSTTGAPVNGAVVTLLNAVTGLPATVYGDDGISSFPATVITGSSVTDGGGQVYNLPPGGFRFPFVAPGSYRFVVSPPAGYAVFSTVPTASLPGDGSGNPYAVVNGSRGEVFAVVPGPALNIDIPADPATGGLFLQKQVSRGEAAAGDFLQYRLTLQNVSASPASAPLVTDRLPAGMRYERGSVRINGQKAAEPAIAADGRTLTFSLATLAVGASTQISYVVQLGAGVLPGEAVNTARATASAGAQSSNRAQVAVRIREPLMSGRATLIGRVYEGDCNTPWAELKPVANARLLLEDGTYVVTDQDGQYHFEGVRPGTHVVQLDVDSLPNGLEPVACMANTRFAGRSFSQFVDLKGGALWRADFFTRARRGEVGIRLESRMATQAATDNRPGDALLAAGRQNVRDYALRAEFDSCSASLNAAGEDALEQLIQELSGEEIQRIELTGNTDNQRLSARCREKFADNHALSEARARTLGDRLAAGLFLRAEQVVTSGRGPDAPIASNRTEEGRARNRRTDLKVYLSENAGADLPTLVKAGSEGGRGGRQITGMSHRIRVDGSTATESLKVMAMLPDGAAYQRGSARIDGVAVDDPSQADGLLGFTLAPAATPGWQRSIEFDTYPLASGGGVAAGTRRYTLRARFDSCSASLHPDSQATLAALVADLQGAGRIERLALTGHSDDLRLSARCRERFPDHQALTEAQAQAVGQALAKSLGLGAARIEAQGAGASAPLAGNDSARGRARNRRIEIVVHLGEDLASITRGHVGAVDCPADALAFKALASFETPDRKRAQTPPVEARLACPAAAAATAAADSAAPAGEGGAAAAPAAAAPLVVEAASPRLNVEVTEHAVVKALPPELVARRRARDSLAGDAEAAGAERAWLDGESPGTAWLFPAPDHNPRAPAVRVVIKHLPGQSVTLKQADGSAVSGLNFEGVQTSADRKVAASVWRGVPLKDGANEFTAEIRDGDDSLVATLRQTVHYANRPVQARLVADKSILLADGLNRPMLAVQLLDRDGRPVRAGVTGPVRIGAPYRSWQEVEMEQKRQLAGLDRFEPQYRVEGDEGIAYIELAPTTESGTVQLDFSFQTGDDSRRRQEIRAWLEPAARDWVLVGFAEGTVGYNTLRDNSQALAGQVEEGAYSDGQVSLYAKGRVLGKWLLTMAYDSDKPERRQSLLGVIDPNEFYTLYGDTTEQRYDAPSQAKLYLKIERGQFYALFGDYDTGLTQTQLSRYSRRLNGFKTENAGGPVVFTAFAAETPQNFARDEIQGDGTSGLYRLRQRNIVLNSEQIRLETRDRLHSEKILEVRPLTRHIDYDIDYSNGTLFFRQPVNSRDFNFNPIFIVAEYETLGVASEELNAGGRVGLSLQGGKVQVGVTGIHDETNLGATDLAGTDLRVKVGRDAEVRVEVAQSSGQVATLTTEGLAWLSEYELHSGRLDLLLYARRQEPGFGLSQQNLAEGGQQKLGAEGQWRLAPGWSVLGRLYQQENLVTTTTREAAETKLQYRTEQGGFYVGAQAVRDSTDSGVLAGQEFRSEQLTAGANRYFLNRKLELSAQAESALGGNSASVDYPERYTVGASYALTDHVRLLAGQEFTDGAAFDTSTTRAGLQVVPWKGARLDSTLNQSDISEYGPRTFAQFGLTQALMLNQHWGVDFSLDSSQTLAESGRPVLVVNPAYPVAPGGSLSAPGLTEDFVAISTGATYRAPVWSWNGRAEHRDGETTDRYGLTSNFLRQAQAGVAFASSAQLFRTEQNPGTDGLLAGVDLSWAWRPLGVQWSILDRLEFRYEEAENTALALFGNTSLVGTASTRRIINNFALNRVSREWTGADRTGNLFRRYERNQWSFYYGAKYVLDSFDGEDYEGYTDLLGVEARHDLKPWLDIGVQASALNSWGTDSHAYSFGPQLGVSPVENGWVTLGWNLRGFSDRDFDAARYTAQGPYLQLRFKFDQKTRLTDFRRGGAEAGSESPR